MTILLPQVPRCNWSGVSVLDYGGLLTPPFGGEVQNLMRIGDRYQLDVSLAKLRASSPDAMIWTSRITRARREGARFYIPLDGFNPGAPGSPLVSSPVASNATVVPVKGMTPGYVVREGQWFTIVHSSRRYLQMAAADTTIDGSGNGSVSVALPLRTSLSTNDVIEIAQPSIEGNLTTSTSWASGVDLWLDAPKFTIAEAK